MFNKKRLIDVKKILKIHIVGKQYTKVGKHIPSSFSMSTISTFNSIKNKHDVYRGKDRMKKVCELKRALSGND